MTARDEFVRATVISALQPLHAVGRKRGWNGRQSFSRMLFLTILLAALTQFGCSNSSDGSFQPPPIAHSVGLEWIDSASPVIGYNVIEQRRPVGPTQRSIPRWFRRLSTRIPASNPDRLITTW